MKSDSNWPECYLISWVGLLVKMVYRQRPCPNPDWLGIFIIRHIAYIKMYIYNKRGGWKYVCYKCYRAEKKLIWNH